MKRLLRSPAFWLLVLEAAALFFHFSSSNLKPRRVPDTKGYLDLVDAESWTELISSYRTAGYPLFLRMVLGPDRDLAAVPLFHLLALLAGIYALWWALARYTGRPWLAFAGVVPLLASRSLTVLQRIQSDMLAVALGLVSVALLLCFATAPRSRLFAAALTLAVFATYQVRPSYLFLVVLVPLAGPALRLFHGRDGNLPSMRSLGRWSLVLAGLALGPWILFSAFRWAVVGEFGLVPFGGYSLAGLASSMLDDELVEELPAEHRSLAREILDRREEAGLPPFHAKGLTRKWYSQYNGNVWQRAVPAVRERLDLAEGREARGDRSAAINGELTAFSKAILVRRPALYRKWILDSFVYGFSGAVDDVWIVWLSLALLMVLPVLALPRVAGEEPAWRPLVATTFLAALFVAGSLGLIVLVEVPFRRYVATIAVLVPAVLAMALFETLRLGRLRLAALRRPSAEGSGGDAA